MQWLDKLKQHIPKNLHTEVTQNIKSKIEAHTDPHSRYFLALILKERDIKAIVFEEKQNHASLVDSGHVHLDHNLETISDDDLLTYVDQAIGIAEKTFPNDVKTTKAVFAVDSWWIENNSIAKEYLPKIKKICKELELTPIGFVDLNEAIIHLLKTEEGASPTALVIHIGVEKVTVSVVRVGKIEQTIYQSKDDRADAQVTADIIASLGNVEHLPSRFILYDGGNTLEEVRQAFLAYPWTRQLPFLHFPKIETLKNDIDTKAVVSGAAKEMGFAFETDESIAQSSVEPTQPEAATPEFIPSPPLPVPVETQLEEAPVEGGEDDFGFQKETDIVDHSQDAVEEVPEGKLNEQETLAPISSEKVEKTEEIQEITHAVPPQSHHEPPPHQAEAIATPNEPKRERKLPFSVRGFTLPIFTQ
jgi:hypothetical protein